MNSQNPLGVYIHIPFCLKKCDYCDFYSLSDISLVPDFCGALARDMSSFDFSGRVVDTIYFGGGTPSIIGAGALCSILQSLKACCRISSDAEITLEANPATIDAQALEALREAGFNRLSVGVQSADDDELRMLGRAHNFAQAAKCIGEARLAGFDNISFDLIYGLPGQTTGRFLASCERIASFKPEHVSFYCLKLEDGTPLAKRLSENDLPDEDELFCMYDGAAGFFETRGFAQYEISNLAMPGFESRHNLRYWTGEDYVGFGPGAHSLVGGSRFFTRPDLAAYIKYGGRLSGIEPVGKEEALAEFLMLRLRLAEGINPAMFERRFVRPFEPYAAALLDLPRLAACQNGRYRLTREGFFVSNSIIVKLLEIQEEQKCAQS